jgi:hypothetical protein
MATPKPIRILSARRIIEAIMLRRFLPVFVIVWLQASSAWAADPARHITQYAHTAWRIEDGAFNSAPWTIVQTPDGYMWIGTADGVLQFDGVHFVRWTPGQGQRLPNSEVLRLRTTLRRERVDQRPWLSESVEGAHAHELRHWLGTPRAGRGQRRDDLARTGLAPDNFPPGNSPAHFTQLQQIGTEATLRNRRRILGLIKSAPTSP